jgi:hypothetical protein
VLLVMNHYPSLLSSKDIVIDPADDFQLSPAPDDCKGPWSS